jgi:peptidyl-prolyl cis-trans isomerase SurA
LNVTPACWQTGMTFKKNKKYKKMTFKYYVIAFVLICTSNSFAQSNEHEVLFTVDNEPVYVSEFVRVYNKNLDLVQDESQKDIDEYLSLFTNYKLKLKEAKFLKLHEKPAYKRELKTYKEQLTKSYITDTKVTEALIKEAYQRVSYDVKANHILVKVSDNATPRDTLIAYNKILKLRDRALSEGFDKVRKEVHNGQTVYGEELGYFSGFKMVYKFETVAFNTPVGEISQPFRTQFGYHIVNVLDKRKSLGEVTVAHIMVANKEEDTLAEKPEDRIQDIYKKIIQGEDFEALAKQFSDDKSSASKGGMLSPFSRGQISAQEFEDVAFSLDKIGDVSEPFQTPYGWHIVKLYNKNPVAPFEVLKPELEQKVKRDSRSKLIDEALASKLKKQYKVENNKSALSYFVSILSDNYFKRTWKLPNDFDATKLFLKIEEKEFTFKEFGDYLLKTQRNPIPKTSFKDVIFKKYDAFLSEKLIEYKKENLEHESEAFANILNEYREGLLLFDLMETTIWNASKADSVEIQIYYNNHKEKYVTPKRINAVVASSSKQKTLKKVSKLLEKGLPLDKIKNLVNSNDKVQVIFTSDVMDAGHQSLPDHFQFVKGISKIYRHNDTFVVIQVKEVLPETQRTLEEAKGTVVSDYQTYKEEKWLKELSEKYKVVINKEVLNQVKSQIKNQ